MSEIQRKKILITVMTYPHPSEPYKELICTAGITEDNNWIRLYPVDYRYQPAQKRFRKYQWIEVDLELQGSENDNRLESRKPILETLRILGEPISAKNNWEERRRIVDKMPHCSVNQLQQLYDRDKISLGIVRPKRVLDLIVEPTKEKWKPKWQYLFSQLHLFEKPQKPLRKLPFNFKYVFECEDSTRPQQATILDWELGVLFLKESDKYGSDEAAAESVKNKFLNELCSSKKDTRFFMGTRFPYNLWMVLGVFWPPKTAGG